MMVYIIEISRDIAQPGLARLSGGQKVASSNLAIPTIFFARKAQNSGFELFYFRAKKNEAVRLRFMHRRCASWHNVPLHTAKPCFIKA